MNKPDFNLLSSLKDIRSGIIFLFIGLLLTFGLATNGLFLDDFSFSGSFLFIGWGVVSIAGAWLGSNTAHFEAPPIQHQALFGNRLAVRGVILLTAYALCSLLAAFIDNALSTAYHWETIAKMATMIFGSTVALSLSSLLSKVWTNRFLTTFATIAVTILFAVFAVMVSLDISTVWNAAVFLNGIVILLNTIFILAGLQFSSKPRSAESSAVYNTDNL